MLNNKTQNCKSFFPLPTLRIIMKESTYAKELYKVPNNNTVHETSNSYALKNHEYAL